jgi:long-chain acyl-CoA synthetase
MVPEPGQATQVDCSRFGLVRTEPDRQIPSVPRTVPEVIEHGRATWPERTALVGRHAQLAEEVAAATSALHALGVRPGDRVAATTSNHTEIVIAFFAAQQRGAIWVGINRSLAGPEKRFILEDSGANYYFADREALEQIETVRETLPELRAIIDMEPGDQDSGWARRLREHAGARPEVAVVDPFGPAAIAYTSGTTGFPKGVVHSQHNIVLVGAMGRLAGNARGVERAGVALPLTILNLMILGPVASFQSGRTCVLMDRIDSLGLAEWIRDEKVESFAAVPTMIYDLMTNPEVKPEDIASFKAPGVGGAGMPESFREFYRQRFGRELSTGYGLTEAPTSVTGTDPEKPTIPGSSGKPARHLRVSIQDPNGRILPPGESGEICVGSAVEGEFAGLYTRGPAQRRRPSRRLQRLSRGDRTRAPHGRPGRGLCGGRQGGCATGRAHRGLRATLAGYGVRSGVS